MYCEHCGQKRQPNDKFCTTCGTAFSHSNIQQPQQSTNNTALIIGFISWIFIAIPIISIPIAITSLIIGTKNKQRLSQLIPAIISITISILGTIFIILAGIFFSNQIETNLNNGLFEEEYYENYYYEYNPESESYDISAYHWLGDDNSLLALNSNNNYIWYANISNQEDNYYQGTYEVYTGEDAIFYIANNLSEYGLTEYIQQQNIITSNHSINEYYLIILNCEKIIINGTEQTPTNTVAYYYGYYEKATNYLDLINIDNQSKAGFTRKEAINTIGIHKSSQI